MQVIIRKRFRDIETRQIMKVGEVVEYDEERAQELARGRFVSIIGEEVQPEDDEALTGDVNDTDKGSDTDTGNAEKGEVTEDKTDKSETSHVSKSETSQPGKPGRKTKK